ncbi:MAG: sigma-70 family RNA polymerase sigma factor [Planctomycetota bacterium]
MNDSIEQTAELLDRLCAEAVEDRSVLSELFEKARPRLLRIVALRSPSQLQQRADPDDIVQETFIRATERFESYAREGQVPVFVWLRGLAYDMLIEFQRKHLRAAKRAVGREAAKRNWLQETSLEMTQFWDSDAKSPSQIISDRQRVEDLKRAIEQLPENYREVLVLRFFESLSVVETAAAMECTVANAKVLQFRAMKKLQAIVTSQFGWESADKR